MEPLHTNMDHSYNGMEKKKWDAPALSVISEEVIKSSPPGPGIEGSTYAPNS